MRKFARTHWKVLIAILLAIALATLTLETDSAPREPGGAARLQAQVSALALEGDAARRIADALEEYGYAPRRGTGTVEVSVANVAPGARAERVFVVGARGAGSDAAAVLELARLLRGLQPSRGTELRFVFFPSEAAPADGEYRSFIAFAGALDRSPQVRQALAAFKAAPDVPAQGLAARAHVMGVTLSDHASFKGRGAPALMVTETSFRRYPYYQTSGDAAGKPDYEDMARVLRGLAQTIRSLAGATQA